MGIWQRSFESTAYVGISNAHDNNRSNPIMRRTQEFGTTAMHVPGSVPRLQRDAGIFTLVVASLPYGQLCAATGVWTRPKPWHPKPETKPDMQLMAAPAVRKEAPRDGCKAFFS